MSERLHAIPSRIVSPEAQWDVAINALNPMVRSYVENLRAQIGMIFHQYQAGDYKIFRSLALQHPSHIPQDAIKHVEVILNALQEAMKTNDVAPDGQWRFTIRHARNPYKEIFNDNGISGKIASVEVPLQIDLNVELQRQRAWLSERGLHSWLENMPQELSERTIPYPSDHYLIGKELKRGAIPLFFPGALHQLSLDAAQAAIDKFRPYILRGGKIVVVGETEMVVPMMGKIASASRDVVRGSPEEPYLLLVQPARPPLEETLDKTLREQKDQYTVLMTKQYNPYLHPLTFFEYLAAHDYWTHHCAEHFRNKGVSVRELLPWDTETYTRFITIRPFRDRKRIPMAHMGNNPEHVRIHSASIDSHSLDQGYRIATKIPLKNRTDPKGS